jgi:hypothetical protein
VALLSVFLLVLGKLEAQILCHIIIHTMSHHHFCLSSCLCSVSLRHTYYVTSSLCIHIYIYTYIPQCVCVCVRSCVCTCTYIHIYVRTYTYICMYIYKYACIQRERERKREKGAVGERLSGAGQLGGEGYHVCVCVCVCVCV